MSLKASWLLHLGTFGLFLALSCASSSQSAVESNDTTFATVAQSAAAAREAGLVEKALGDYERAVQIRGDWEEGWWYLGTLRYDVGQYAKAIPPLKRVLELDSAMGGAWTFLGLCEFETGNYTDALADLKKGQVFDNSDDPEIARVSQFHVALLLIRAGDFDEAYSILKNSFVNEPTEQVKIAMGLALLRVPLLPQEIDPSRDALLHAASDSFSALARGNATEIDRSFRGLLQAFPQTPYLHYQFGKALASFNRLEEALNEERAEIKLSPASELPRIEISRIELHASHLKNAVEAAREAVNLNPDSLAAHEVLRLSEQALTRSSQFVDNENRAPIIAQSSPIREARIVELYSRSTVAMAPAAQHSSSRTAELQELSSRASSLEEAGNINAAIKTYREGLQLDPSWDEGRWKLATLYYSASQCDETISELGVYLVRNVNNGTAWAMMGLCEFQIKRYENALIHLQHGNELGMGGSKQSIKEAKYKLGVLLNQVGHHEEAVRILASEAESTTGLKDFDLALGMALLRISLFPEQVDSSRRDLLQKAGAIAVLLQRSKYDQAFLQIQFLLTQYPTTPFLHYVYGVGLASLSRFDEAKTQLREELKISPQSELPYIALASTALQEREPGDALAPALQATRLAPKSAQAHYLLGRAQLELGNNVEALKELRESETLAPGSPEVHFNLAKAYGKAQRLTEQSQELQTFQRLSQTSPGTQGNQN